MRGAAGAPAVAEPAVDGHRRGNEREGAARGVEPVRLVEGEAGADEGGDHQTVPVRENLVVEPRWNAFLTYFQ